MSEETRTIQALNATIMDQLQALLNAHVQNEVLKEQVVELQRQLAAKDAPQQSGDGLNAAG